MSASVSGAEGETSPPPQTETGTSESSNQGTDDGGQFYECNVCLDTARDPVVSMCGHLFWYEILLSILTV